MKQRTLLLGSLGAGLEYYDFVIYALLTPYFTKALFPQLATSYAHTIAFLIFAFGFLIRPVGGTVLGWLADRFGRKTSFCAVMWIMAAATLGIALIPSASHIGYGAAVLLFILRLCQGVAFGGELPCGVVFMAEHANQKHRGLMCSLMIANVGLGYALATGVCYALTQHFAAGQMVAFGWRIAFAIGAVVALLALYLRRRLLETPVFLQQNRSIKVSFWTAISVYRRPLLKAIGLVLFPAALVTFDIVLPVFPILY